MATFSHANEPHFRLTIGDMELLVVDFSLREQISVPFEANLSLASEDEIQFNDVVGKVALFTLESADSDRHVHGIVDKFMQTGMNGRFYLYQARLIPQISLLSLEQDCRIFQQKSVPDIVKEVLNDSGITSDQYDFRLQGSYAPREYCVQYRETDLNFLSRLLEEEGIFYFFEHTDQKHLMVFGNGTVNYKPIAGQPKVIFNTGAGMVAEEEAVYSFHVSRQIRSGKYTTRDYNFERPSLNLTADQTDYDNTTLEVYDYPGEYAMPEDGRNIALVRLQQAVMYKEKGEGSSVSPRLVPGFTFKLTDHPMDAFNREYLLVEVMHRGAQSQVLAEKSGGNGTSYENDFLAIPSAVTVRPEKMALKPVVEGVQTAIVTGPSGEEIYTDKHGRVKVQFHWDRLGNNDEKSSCWTRVSQAWAGAGWGAMFIPRIGQEVIVDFIEGDPDRPIITGRVYHGSNMPPYSLPDEKTKSTLMSQTTPNAKTYNELLMEDKAGETRVVLSNAYGHKLTMDEKEQFFCFETRDGNKITFDDKNKHINALTTNNHMILISDEKKKISVTSTQGHMVEIDDENQKMVAKTANGNIMTMDDRNTKIEIATEIGGHSMVMNDKTVSVTSGGGHLLTLDDGGKGNGISLEDNKGNRIEIDAGGDKIIIEAKGGIDIITTGDLKIQAANIKLNADMDLNMAAGMNVKSEAGLEHKSKGTMLTAEGATTADFKGGVKTTVTGAVVMIN